MLEATALPNYIPEITISGQELNKLYHEYKSVSNIALASIYWWGKFEEKNGEKKSRLMHVLREPNLMYIGSLH